MVTYALLEKRQFCDFFALMASLRKEKEREGNGREEKKSEGKRRKEEER